MFSHAQSLRFHFENYCPIQLLSNFRRNYPGLPNAENTVFIKNHNFNSYSNFSFRFIPSKKVLRKEAK